MYCTVFIPIMYFRVSHLHTACNEHVMIMEVHARKCMRASIHYMIGGKPDCKAYNAKLQKVAK